MATNGKGNVTRVGGAQKKPAPKNGKKGGKEVEGEGEGVDEKEPKYEDFKAEAPADGWTVKVPEGFDFGKHKPLGKKEFSGKSIWMLHRAELFVFKASLLTQKAEALRVDSEQVAKMGDNKTAKAVKKAQKIKNQLATLMAELKEAGVDLESIQL